MVATPQDEEALDDEWRSLTEAGCQVEKMNPDEVVAQTGEASGFSAGLWFPNDAIMDSSAYAKCLLREAERVGSVAIREHCPSVVDMQPILSESERIRRPYCECETLKWRSH